MKALKTTLVAVAALVGAACSTAFAGEEVDTASLYELSTDGSTSKLKAGEKGTFVLQIKAKDGAHVSEEAPLKLEVTGKNVKAEKAKLTLADSVAKKAEGQQYANPRFEVPISAEAAGKGSVDAKLTFFICTDQLCSRQQKTLSVPVEVN